MARGIKTKNHPTVHERFWSKVWLPDNATDEDCWWWTGSKWGDRKNKWAGGGYGCFHYQGHCINAHKAAYMMYRGPVPDGFKCCHTCDRPGCVNPFHIFLGSTQDNIDDSTRKLRRFKKMSLETLPKLRAAIATGKSHRIIAEEFGLCNEAVRKYAIGTYGRLHK
jgi:hypothetical protein